MSAALRVVRDAGEAQALLQPTRLRILRALDRPGSAATLARELDAPRQRLNYHLRELEAHGLVELVEERRRGSVTERVYRRSGERFALSSETLGPLETRPEDIADRLSAAYQIAVASRAVSELGRLSAGAAAAGKELPTLTLEVDVRFPSAARRNEFAERLSHALAELAREFHDEDAAGGRAFRFYLGGYPKPKA